MLIKVEFPSLIDGKQITEIIDPRSPFGEQVIKLFHYADNGSIQIIPVNLMARVDGELKSITIFVSTLSEKSTGYRKSINKRDIEKVSDVVIDDPRFNSPNNYEDLFVKEETMFEKVRRFFHELYESL